MGGVSPAGRRRDDGRWPVVGRPLTHARREQVQAALTEAARLLDRPPPVAAELADAGRALAELGAAWQQATDTLVGSVQGAPGERRAGQATSPEATCDGPARLMALVELVREVKAAEDGVREDRSRLRAGTGDVVREALRELRDARSLADLVEGAPARVARLS